MKNFLILGAIAGLTACGTTTNPPPTTTPPPTTPTPLSGVSKDMTAAISGDDIATIGAGSSVAISIDGVPLVNLLRQSALDSTNNTFQAATASNGLTEPYEIAFSGATASGEMTAVMAGEYYGTSGVTYARTGQTTLPTSGTGSFSGDYVGHFGDPSGGFYLAVHGDASLTVSNWGSPTIFGTITNRKAYLADGTPGPVSLGGFHDIDLASSSIGSDGTYSGIATGGEIVSPPFAVVGPGGEGVYEGLIGGTNGTETAGGLKIDATYGTTAYSETGAFLAN